MNSVQSGADTDPKIGVFQHNPPETEIQAETLPGGLVERDPQAPELAVVVGGAWGEIGVEERRENELAQSTLNQRRMSLVPGALKDLEQNEVPDQNRFATDRLRASPPPESAGRMCAIHTELSTRITTGSRRVPVAFRQGRPPSPIL